MPRDGYGWVVRSIKGIIMRREKGTVLLVVTEKKISVLVVTPRFWWWQNNGEKKTWQKQCTFGGEQIFTVLVVTRPVFTVLVVTKKIDRKKIDSHTGSASKLQYTDLSSFKAPGNEELADLEHESSLQPPAALNFASKAGRPSNKRVKGAIEQAAKRAKN